MRITERIKKIKKLIGSEIAYSHSDEFFTPKSQYSEIIGIQINDLFDLNIIVKCDGTLNPLGTLKKFDVFKILKLPLVKYHMGKYQFPMYNCVNQSMKSVFITKNDIDSSLLKDSQYDLFVEMEKQIQKYKLNIAVKKNFVCDNDVKVISRIFKVTNEEAILLKDMGLTPFGWRNTLDETHVFNPDYFNLDVIHDINSSIDKMEELMIYSGLLKLSKQKLQKTIKKD